MFVISNGMEYPHCLYLIYEEGVFKVTSFIGLATPFTQEGAKDMIEMYGNIDFFVDHFLMYPRKIMLSVV